MGKKMRLTHINRKGEANMVDVSAKSATIRRAKASGFIKMSRPVVSAIARGKLPKGDVFSVARVAGIMAAKNAASLIPLCHPLNIGHCEMTFVKKPGGISITAEVKTTGATGVEMEALAAVSAAALTVYDMCKALDKTMTITNVMLLEKEGGRSGRFKRGKPL